MAELAYDQEVLSSTPDTPRELLLLNLYAVNAFRKITLSVLLFIGFVEEDKVQKDNVWKRLTKLNFFC